MRKILSLILSFIFTMTVVQAESMTKTIKALGINNSALSVSVKEVGAKNEVFSLNERVPRLPASTLKLITSSAAVDTLGTDYSFKTSLYKSTNNDLYLKLSGDPLLTTSDLEKLIETAKNKNIAPKTFYVDETVFDNVEWGEGWQWDDDMNPLMPKFSAYNINKNLVKIDVSPTGSNVAAKLTVKPFYPVTFMNLVITDYTVPTNVKVEKNTTIATNMLNISGRVSKISSILLPVANPKMNFILRLEDAIRSKKFEYFSQIKNAKLPENNVYLVDTVEHDFSSVLPSILKVSSNLSAESLFKYAGAIWSNSQGSIANSLAMLSEYFEKINLNSEDIKIVDGSGVSKNNLMTSDFMTDFLIYKASCDDFEIFKEYLPKPGEGTLKNRMLYFKDNLRAKTGTLSDTSAIAGYITSRRGKLYAFDIMINDAKTSSADKKNIEEQILRNIYLNY